MDLREIGFWVQRPQSRKCVPGSSPGEGDFFSSETKHDIKMGPDQSCLFMRGDYRNKNRKMRSCPEKKVFVTKQDRTTGVKNRIVCLAGRLHE
jgi:hypothetical protein